MLKTISSTTRCPPADGRGPYPQRGLHLIDIENLAGSAAPNSGQIRDVQRRYARRLSVSAPDQVVIASSHLTLLNAALGWPHARYRIRSGPDGADLELLDILRHENIATRFTRVIIGSGDGIFARAAASLATAGVQVTVVSRRDRLSPRLALAAREVIYLDALPPATIPAYRHTGIPARAPASMTRQRTHHGPDAEPPLLPHGVP